MKVLEQLYDSMAFLEYYDLVLNSLRSCIVREYGLAEKIYV